MLGVHCMQAPSGAEAEAALALGLPLGLTVVRWGCLQPWKALAVLLAASPCVVRCVTHPCCLPARKHTLARLPTLDLPACLPAHPHRS